MGSSARWRSGGAEEDGACPPFIRKQSGGDVLARLHVDAGDGETRLMWQEEWETANS